MSTNHGRTGAAIVLDGHTLGVPYSNGLQVLRTLISKGSPWAHDPHVIAFDETLQAGRYRPATENDFEEFRVSFHQSYLHGGAVACAERS